MIKLIPVGKSLLVGAVAVGALSLGTAGMAGAATPTARHFNCARATKALTRIEKAQARIAAGLPKLKAEEAKAAAAGKTVRVARLEKRINRWESTAYKTHLTKRSSNIQAKCNVSAPSVP
jgi:hypothetical protein